MRKVCDTRVVPHNCQPSKIDPTSFDFSGSTKEVARIYRKSCAYISGEPLSEKVPESRRVEKTVWEIQHRNSRKDTCSNEIWSNQALEVAEVYRMLSKMSTKETYEKLMCELPNDTVNMVTTMAQIRDEEW